MQITRKNVASKRRQGRGYVVTSYEPAYGAWTESTELSYWQAVEVVRERRESWNTKTQFYTA